MTKKSLSKVLSIIFTISICVTAVCGCVIATNALDTPEYVIQGSQCNKGDVSASAVVTFTMPEGMGIAAGTFTVDNAGGWYKEMTATVEKADQSDMVDVFTEDGVALFQIYDSESAPKLYNTVTVNLDFVFKDGGITDTVKIKLSDVELNGIYSDENYTNVADNSTDAYFTVGCQHVYVVSGDPVLTSEKFDYSVYNSATCTLCGETKANYQVVPGTEDDGIVELWDGRDENGAWIGWQYSTFSGGTGEKDDPYIIKYSEQLAYLTTASASTYATTAGKYYKVDDSIKAFNMNTTGLDLSGDMTAQEVYNLLNDEVVNRVYWAVAVFAGNLDGNGVEIYGLHTGHMNYVENGTSKTTEQSAALFPKVAAGAVIKNINIKNSYMYTDSTSAYAGGIIGGITTDAATNNSTADTVYIENCVVHDCYIGSKNTNVAPGVVVCYAATNAYLNISNILVYDNEVINAKNTIKSIVGVASKCYLPEGATLNVTNNRLIDSVVLGATPYDANGSWWFKACNEKIFQNVYFDNTIDTSGFGNYGNANSKLTQLSSVDAAKGDAAKTNMPDLDWNTAENPNGVWFTGYNGQYPTLLKKNTQSVADGTNIDWELLGANIVYANDGSFALNFHYEPSYDSDVKLYVANAQNENKTKILTEHTASSFAGTILSADARMFTLSGISAKDINELWLPTIITTNKAGTEIVYGETVQISVGDYAESVVVGDAVYSEGATDAQKTADKNVAAALINYSQAAIDALSVTTAESATTATIIEKWDQYENGKYIGWYNSNLSGEGTEESPYIIDSAEKLAYVCKEVISAGVYYKVADNIKAFDMNTVAGVDFTVDNITATEVKGAVADKILGKVWHPNYSGCFAGNFDGNGVTIYGLYAGPAYYNQASYDSGSKAGCASGALFSKIDTSTATFKNFTIKNSYFTGGNCGAVFAETTLSGGSAKIDNVIVANCYIESTGGTGGAIGGFCKSSIDDTNKNYVLDRVVLNNCLVYDNVISNKNGVAPRLIGSIQAWHWNGTSKVIDANYCSFNNIIAIDCNIFESTSWWSSQKGLFSKCYTTETNVYYNTTITDITQLANADAAKGIAAKTNMPALDWDTVWMYGGEGEYPSIVLTEGKVNPVSEYSGTPDTSSTLEGSGTVEDPYIIATADQFAAIALGKRATVENTYYKVKDGIKAFYMHGGAESAAFTNVEQVKNYFENQTTPTSSTWAKSNNFKANFDGSGVTVYGLFAYNVGQYTYTGLFPQIEGHTSIKNITIKNSYISSNCSDGLGALVGASVWKSDGTYENSVELENIAIINNYICQRGAYANGASAITGSLFNKNYASLNNGIIYGNQLDNSAYTGTGLVSSLFTANPGIGSGDAASAKIQNVIALGVTPWLIKTTATGYTHTNWYLANLSAGAFKNIYTDQSVAALQTYNATNNSDANLSKNNINVVSPSSLQGANAVTTMASAGLGWNTTWFAGNYKDYPSFSPASTMPTNVQLQYDAITLDTCDSYGNSTADFGVYATSLNLNSNPYISFAFAFGGDYKENRDKITVKFTYTVNGTEQTFTTSPSAFTGDGTINGTNNWYNRPSAGRYHTYRFKDIPVEALANPIKVEASYNGGEYVNLGSFSAEGLALDFEREYRLNPCDYYATRIEAVKALLFYTQMIEIRYGA